MTEIKQLISQEEIAARVEAMAAEIAQLSKPNLNEPLLMVALMRGSFIFAADLARALHRHHVALECEFIGLSSYGNSQQSSGKVKLTQDIQASVEGRSVLLIDDILESGHSLTFARKLLQDRGAKNIVSAVMLEKSGKLQTNFTANYVGFAIEDHFVVGYGLDYAGSHRELPFIGIVQL